MFTSFTDYHNSNLSHPLHESIFVSFPEISTCFPQQSTFVLIQVEQYLSTRQQNITKVAFLWVASACRVILTITLTKTPVGIWPCLVVRRFGREAQTVLREMVRCKCCAWELIFNAAKLFYKGLSIHMHSIFKWDPFSFGLVNCGDKKLWKRETEKLRNGRARNRHDSFRKVSLLDCATNESDHAASSQFIQASSFYRNIMNRR